MPAQAKRVGPKKTFENIGGVSTHLLAEAIWFDEGQDWRQRPAGFLGGAGSFFCPRENRGEKSFQFLFLQNGSDEILQKVRKVKEGSRHFW